MLEPIEIKGYWWLPNEPDKRLPGTLTYSQEQGAFLEIVGVFDDRLSNRPDTTEIILGISQQGKPLTLHNCHYTQRTIPVSGLGGAVYRAKFVFEGVHFEKVEDIKFNQLCGKYTDLDSWVDIYGFSIDIGRIENRFKASIEYILPDAQLFQINDDIEVGVGFSSEGPRTSIVQTEVKITQEAYLFVRSNTDDIAFEDLFQYLEIFTTLHQLAVQRMNYPLKIFGFTEANAEECVEGKITHPVVNIYYQPIEPYVERKELIPQYMLFAFKDLNEEQIRNWFTKFDTYQTVIHLYRTLFYSDRLFIENRFLNVAQALESLHSILFENRYLPKEEFSVRRNIVIDAVPEDLMQWVDAALNNANYKSFRLKIYELLEKKAKLFSKCIMDNDQFAARVRDTRNEFVHHRKQTKSFRGGEELISAIYLLTYLFEAYILEIIGFSEEKIKEIYEPRIKKYLTRWRKL